MEVISNYDFSQKEEMNNKTIVDSNFLHKFVDIIGKDYYDNKLIRMIAIDSLNEIDNYTNNSQALCFVVIERDNFDDIQRIVLQNYQNSIIITPQRKEQMISVMEICIKDVFLYIPARAEVTIDFIKSRIKLIKETFS